jgi:multidrug efflux system membrane fusion protein
MPNDQTLQRRLKLTGGVAAVAALAAIGWGVYARAHDVHSEQTWSQARAIPVVRVVTPEPADGAQPLDLPGNLQAYNEAPIYARVSGYLKSWNQDIGAHVKAGQVLAVIDAPELDQQLAGAKASLAAAQANLKLANITAQRFNDLAQDESVSKQDADEKTGAASARQAALQGAQAEVQRLEALENFKRITAPFDGVVTQRNANIGALINAGGGQATALFSVADVHLLRVYVQAPQSVSAAIRPGLQASLTLPQYPGRSFPAQVVSDAGALGDKTGALLVELQVANDHEMLKPGDYAQVRFSIAGGAGVVRVPASAIIFRRNGLQIATVDAAGRAHLQSVAIARDLGGQVELSGGLAPNTRVIDSPPDSLEDGDALRIAKTDSENQGSAGANG